jgi:hypothetical protein
MPRLDLLHTRRRLLKHGLAGLVAVAGLAIPAAAAKRAMTAYRNPGCGCCGAWAKSLEPGGIAVTMIDDADLAGRRTKAGVPAHLAGCHTGFIDGYVIEGHVPLRDILKLIEDKPAALGLAVAGMPMGSPGMDFGPEKEPYDVMLFEAGGATRVFARYT